MVARCLRVSRSMAPTPLKILSMSIMPVRASIALCCMLTCTQLARRSVLSVAEGFRAELPAAP